MKVTQGKMSAAKLLCFFGLTVLLFGFAPVHAQSSEFKSTSAYPINASVQQPSVANQYSAYKSTIYSPFTEEVPSGSGPSRIGGRRNSGSDDDDDIGIPGWTDTPSEPAPIGDAVPLFLFAAVMIAVIWIKQRKHHTTQHYPTLPNTTPHNPTLPNTTQHMTTRKQTYQSFFQKLFLLLVFVSVAGQLSGQTVYQAQIFNKAASSITNFPKTSNTNYGKVAYQAGYSNGAFYASDWGYTRLYKITETTSTNNWQTGITNLRAGCCSDEAGNLIMNVSPSNTQPTKLTIYKDGDKTQSCSISFTSLGGQNNLISAKGNVIGGTGYVYFFPAGSSAVKIIEISQGEYVKTHTISNLSITAPDGGGYVVPIEGTTRFLYQDRSKGYYLYDGSNKGLYMSATSDDNPPALNKTFGGAVFKLGSTEYFVHPSGTNYNGGWTIRILSNKTVLWSQTRLASGGSTANGSCGQFYTLQPVDNNTVKLYEYVLGNGIAAWTLRGSANKNVRIQTHDGNADGANKSANWGDNVNGGTIKFAYYANSTNANSTTTANITTGGYKYYTDVNPDKNITLTATPNSEYTFIGWWNNGATYTANPWTHVAKNSNQSITARFAKLKQQTINIHTYDTESNTYIANAIGGTVTVSYNNALTEDNTSATLSSTSGSYKALINSTVTLTATPKSGYVFVGWYKGDEHLDWAKTNECSFKADNAYNITARFTKLVTQTFKVQTYESTAYADGGNGGTMTVNYNDGTTETVTNSTPISNLYQGYNVTLTANAKTGYKFMGWFNNDFTTEYSKGSNTYTYRGESTCTIYARFRKTYNQTVNISTYNPATGQYVASSDGGVITTVTYDDGNAQSLSNVTNSTFTPLVNTLVTVTAESKSGYKFNGWYSGETLLSEDAEYTYTVNAEKTITARFASQNVELTVSVLNYNTSYNEFREYEYEYNKVTLKQGNSVLKESYSSFSHEFNDATSVTLTATPEEGEDGYDFIGWYQNNTLLSDQLTINVNVIGMQAISAHFAPKKCFNVRLISPMGGTYSVKYARESLFDQEGMYYVVHTPYKEEINIFVPYDAKIAVVNPNPINGYEYIGFKVFHGQRNNDGSYSIIPPLNGKYEIDDLPVLIPNFVRTEEQVVYLDISNKDKNLDWKNVTEFACNMRNPANNSVNKEVLFTKVDEFANIYKITIEANTYDYINIIEKDKATEHSTTRLAIPSTRYNCFKLNAHQSSTGEWVDAWTTLPTLEGDYRLIYREQTVVNKNEIRIDYEFNEGDRIKNINFNTQTAGTQTDTVSLHIYNKVSNGINGVNNPEVILQQWNGTEWADVERYMVFGPLRSNDAGVIKMPHRKNTTGEKISVDQGIGKIIAAANNDDDQACGVWNFVIQQTKDNASNVTAKLLVDQTHRYKGDYYIRTTNADGQYNNYTHPGNVMKHSEYAAANSDYSHYFIRYVDINEDGTPTSQAGKHNQVKFTVATAYTTFLCKELMINNNRFSDDEYENDIFVINDNNNPKLPADATVRFGWDSITNRLTRAYIANTTIKNNEYLVVEGSNIGSPSGEATYFTDNSNWLYSIDLPSATTGATAKVKAKMNGEYQYFMGAQPGSQDEYETLISGNGTNTYPIRLLYDFKDDRFTTIYHPESGTINNDVTLSTPLMIEREHNAPATQIQLTTNKITTVKAGEDQYTQPAYAVMTFLESVLADASKTHHEKMFYWISFPFDVCIRDVFGLGDYGKYWIMEYYDGAQRAKSGLAQNNWKYITKKSAILEKNKGYVLCLNYSQILQDQLFKSYGGSDETLNNGKLSLYFPSNSVISPADITGGLTREDTLAQYDNTTMGSNTAGHHHNWHIIGVPSFADPTLTDVQTDAPFVYQYWHPGDAYAAKAYTEITFNAMHAYMVQYYGTITWESVVNTTPKSLAARTDEQQDKKIMLRLELQQAGSTLDKTYVQLRNDKGTKGFDMSLDLTKIINAGANIYSIVDNHEMAGNAVPKEESIIPLGVEITAAGEYTFAMPNGTQGMIVELIDYDRNTSTNLLVYDYTITLPKGTFNQRFALRLKPDKVATSVENIGDGASADEAKDVRKLLLDGVLYLQKGSALYDAQGHLIR